MRRSSCQFRLLIVLCESFHQDSSFPFCTCSAFPHKILYCTVMRTAVYWLKWHFQHVKQPTLDYLGYPGKKKHEYIESADHPKLRFLTSFPTKHDSVWRPFLKIFPVSFSLKTLKTVDKEWNGKSV